ncbi:hypothetical protein BCR43DRAFT_482313 [Syncephalastrum racemosum]|uniref:Probable RNA polymerase II nuclear localization protein SLC7A6OS n=1 Tax=Syncephalastrum racemosum TaxID=13706 RepID=A0A1X2HTJ3_SYNRA|nr:hypothetical protein BCR43DRAFT_482313 [Syncephalastrum racemosum]
MDTPPLTSESRPSENKRAEQHDMPQQMNFVRIKRKRNEEPLEALLFQEGLSDAGHPNEKRSRKHDPLATSDSSLSVNAVALPTIFRLVETVDEKSFTNVADVQKLKERLSRRSQINVRPHTPETSEERKDRLAEQHQRNAKQARYRVIAQNRSKAEDGRNADGKTSEQEISQLLDMYEAVREEDIKQPKLFPGEECDDPDDIMCNFIPMVKEYLTLNEKTPMESDEYVYDVYYRDDSNANVSVHSTNVASLVWYDDADYMNNNDEDSELGDNEDEDSNAEDYYQNDYPDTESDLDFEDQNDYVLSSDDDEDYYV